MRLRSFSGRTMNEAMSLVRQHLGSEAIIVSTQEDDQGLMRVTAALDAELAPRAAPTGSGAIDAIGTALDGHGLSPDLTEKIVAAALPYDEEEPLVALSSALATLFPFRPVVAEDGRRSFFLAGPPGSGKTVTAAKLAARAVFGGEARAPRHGRRRARRRGRSARRLRQDSERADGERRGRGTACRRGSLGAASGARHHRRAGHQSLFRFGAERVAKHSPLLPRPRRCSSCRRGATRSIRSKWRASSPPTAARGSS